MLFLLCVLGPFQIVHVIDRLMSSSESSAVHNLKFGMSNYSARLGFSRMI
uniref:Uncharacterized protein n=1 Tax=Arundo donax TaxID=35708 RepID=A0A0A9FGG3_ARUDO